MPGIKNSVSPFFPQKMPVIKREAEKVPEEEPPVEEPVESTLKTFLSTEVEIKEGKRHLVPALCIIFTIKIVPKFFTVLWCS